MVLFGQGLGAVAHGQDQVGLGQGLAAAGHAQLLDGVVAVPQARGVNEAEEVPAQGDFGLDGVAGGAGDVRDDGPLIPRQGVEQGGLACVGAADQNAGDALMEQRPPAAGGQERLQRRFLPGEDLPHLFGLEGVDVLVGIV